MPFSWLRNGLCSTIVYSGVTCAIFMVEEWTVFYNCLLREVQKIARTKGVTCIPSEYSLSSDSSDSLLSLSSLSLPNEFMHIT